MHEWLQDNKKERTTQTNSNGLHSNGLQPNSTCLEPNSDGFHPNSNGIGMQRVGVGMQGAVVAFVARPAKSIQTARMWSDPTTVGASASLACLLACLHLLASFLPFFLPPSLASFFAPSLTFLIS